VVPEKQGLKLPPALTDRYAKKSLSSGSRKTRIETYHSEVFQLDLSGLSSGSRKTRIETQPVFNLNIPGS